ncbi:ABC transporter permease subunit [Streptomyces sp. NPDC051366]|uniref:ABC transporter permease subunit n=1 Tax=Streptomyces sp. NPDC051366 TaxID=3365652 RepID=UPI0037934A23
MNRLVRAETRRLLRHPLALTLAALFVFGSLYCAWVSQNMASYNITQVQANLDFLPRSCESPRNTPEQKAGCLAEVPMQAVGLERIQDRFTAEGVRAAHAQHPVGSLLWTVRLLTSVPGLALLVMLAAFSVAGEWSRGSIVPLLLYESRLSRLLAAKALAVWVWSLALLCVSAAVTAAFGLSYGRNAYPLPSPGALGTVLADTALGVLAAAAAVAVALGALLRRPMRTFLAGMLLLVLVVRTSAAPGLGAWLPGGALADLVGFGAVDDVWDHFWISTDPSTAPVLLRVLPTLALIGLLWLGLDRLNRTRDRA